MRDGARCRDGDETADPEFRAFLYHPFHPRWVLEYGNRQGYFDFGFIEPIMDRKYFALNGMWTD